MNKKNDICDAIKCLGWKIVTGKDQIFGSPSDVYAEYKKYNHYMLIEDGNVGKRPFYDKIYHIYASIEKRDSKIFEGRIKTLDEFKVVMKVLGY